jgi:hypothetical protein
VKNWGPSIKQVVKEKTLPPGKERKSTGHFPLFFGGLVVGGKKIPPNLLVSRRRFGGR